MTKKDISLTGYSEETIRVLGKPGCVLVSGTMNSANAMTIGWGTIGMLWGRPVFMVAVRPSRHTFNLIEKTGEFTVNVPAKGMEEVVSYCGTVSGRDENKLQKKHIAYEKGKETETPILTDFPINYECRVMFKTEMLAEKIPEQDKKKWYPKEDYHTIYFGEIVSARADEDAMKKLP